MPNNCCPPDDPKSKPALTETSSVDQHQPSIQVPVTHQCQQTACTTSNNVNQYNLCPGYQQDQSTHGQPCHGDRIIESTTQAAETLTSLETVRVRRVGFQLWTLQDEACTYGKIIRRMASAFVMKVLKLLKTSAGQCLGLWRS
jgi:hypothetical protein